MKKTWVRFLGMLLALLMALGCTAAFAEGDDFSGTVTISLYSAKGVQEAWEAVGAAYTAKHPNVKVVVDLKPQDGYADWVKAAFQGYDSALPEADIVYGNLAGSDRVDKVVNFYEYAFDDSPYSDGTWADQIVDNGMKLGCNHPMGPLELADMIGLDILLNVMTVMEKEIGDKYRPSMILRKMVTAGFLGRKSGAGFYLYENGKKIGVNPVLTQVHTLSEN